MDDITYHDENTLHKVYKGLRSAGLEPHQAVDAVFQMQNEGIFFRESQSQEVVLSCGWQGPNSAKIAHMNSPNCKH